MPRRIVWVEDNPINNAYEIARLRDDGVEVVELTSTEEAVRHLVGQRIPVRAVVSDLGRREAGTYRPRAGVELIQQLRAAGFSEPIFIYSSARAIERTRDDVLAAGGTRATASPVELSEVLRGALGWVA